MDQIEYQGSPPLAAAHVRGSSLARQAGEPDPPQPAALGRSQKQPDGDRAAETGRSLSAPGQDIGPPASLAGSCWRRLFAGEARQLGLLRRWLASLLPECGARDDATYAATELAANAVMHTASGRPGGQFAVEVLWSPSTVRIAVGDGGASSGPRVANDPAGECGRGLMVVTGLAARTGVWGDERGRVVWADVPWEKTCPVGAASPIYPRTLFSGLFLNDVAPDSMPPTDLMPSEPVAGDPERWASAVTERSIGRMPEGHEARHGGRPGRYRSGD
jgi:serine/threonine-protein kinase RsbW